MTNEKKTKITESKAVINKVRNEIEDKKVVLYNDIEGKFMHIKVGDAENTANGEVIEDIEDKINKLFNDNNVDCIAFVTHHAVEIKLIERSI